jgi:hypothetical protein
LVATVRSKTELKVRCQGACSQYRTKDEIGYYTFFPPKAMNVAVETVNVPDGKGGTMSKKVLVVTKDFNAGEVIYRVNLLFHGY